MRDRVAFTFFVLQCYLFIWVLTFFSHDAVYALIALTALLAALPFTWSDDEVEQYIVSPIKSVTRRIVK